MNTFGRNFRCTSFGESHGPAIGVIVDGCPAGLSLSPEDIQPFLDRRRPGTSDLVSQRREPDQVSIFSGLFGGRTTGMPIMLMIKNRDVEADAYETIRDLYRPGHADFTYDQKYGIRDHRGGGRSSGRETAARVAAGAIARIFLERYNIVIHGRIQEVHGKTDDSEIAEEIRSAQGRGDSVGGIVEVIATGCPVGLGDPVFGKLDAQIASGMMGIGAVKGVEIGEGFHAAVLYGSENNDQITEAGFLTNHAGGILGGISNGEEIVVRIAVKPTPSISIPQKTIDRNGKERVISVRGRHDPCIVPRILPVAEAMLALVIIDCLLENAKYQVFGDLTCGIQRPEEEE
jgi:chorismate synthase